MVLYVYDAIFLWHFMLILADILLFMFNSTHTHFVLSIPFSLILQNMWDQKNMKMSGPQSVVADWICRKTCGKFEWGWCYEDVEVEMQHRFSLHSRKLCVFIWLSLFIASFIFTWLEISLLFSHTYRTILTSDSKSNTSCLMLVDNLWFGSIKLLSKKIWFLNYSYICASNLKHLCNVLQFLV